MYKYILFDLDGTLTNPEIGITSSVMYALEKFNIKVENRKELHPFIGFMDGFPSGQRGQTVNLLAPPSKVRILLHPFWSN